VEVRIPANYLDAVRRVREALPDCPLDALLVCLVACHGDAAAALAALCDAEDRPAWAAAAEDGGADAAVDDENTAEYEAVLRQLRGPAPGGGTWLPAPARGAARKGGGANAARSSGQPAATRAPRPSQRARLAAATLPGAPMPQGAPVVNAPAAAARAAPASTSVAGGPPASAAAAAAAAAAASAAAAAETLRGLLSHLSLEQAAFAVRRHPASVDAAADYALGSAFDEDFAIAQRAGSARGAKAAQGAAGAGDRDGDGAGEDVRNLVLRRYDERPDVSDKRYRPGLPLEMLAGARKRGDKELRFLDGKAVFMRKGACSLTRALGE
jgi:hypothetical protein